jgi:hypothetical protein
MVRNDTKASAWAQQWRYHPERFGQALKFPIHRYSEGLKGAGCGMYLRPRSGNSMANDLGEIASGPKLSSILGPGHGTGDLARVPFFAVFGQNSLQLAQ